jgi:hypothetical protein
VQFHPDVFRIGYQHITEMIDPAAVDLLGHLVVVAQSISPRWSEMKIFS